MANRQEEIRSDRYYIGLDLGTSSLKGILTDRTGRVLREASSAYDVLYPKNGWTEQEPSAWLSAMKDVLKTLSDGLSDKVAGLSVGGQMHGLVVLDDEDTVIRPCILWNDGRTEEQTSYLNDVIGRKKLSLLTGNIAFAGFTAPKILWLRENEPDNFARIRKIMLPKDYLAYQLTGVFSTDYSDASGTLLLDVAHKEWSHEMCRICGITEAMLPRLYESWEVTGRVKPEFGLSDCVVTAGAGDNAAAAVGTGCVQNGACNISLGTSGTIFICQDTFSVDSRNALHSFAHASGGWHLMGCILTAASARKWWLEDILGTHDYLADDEAAVAADSGDLIFLPYLSGERSPHNDVNARGAFIGLSAGTTHAQMSRAVMEGVAFALRDCLEIAAQNGVRPSCATLCGGGAKSSVWRQIMADALDLPVCVLQTEQGPSLGGALLAMVGAGEYASVAEAASATVRVSDTILPDPARAAALDKKYRTFVRLYPALRAVR